MIVFFWVFVGSVCLGLLPFRWVLGSFGLALLVYVAALIGLFGAKTAEAMAYVLYVGFFASIVVVPIVLTGLALGAAARAFWRGRTA